MFMSYVNNKGANQSAHLRSLTSAFIFRCLDSIISVLAMSKISVLSLLSVPEQSDLVANPEDRLSRHVAHFDSLL